MKVTISSNELQKKLSFVSHAISTRSQLPILLHVLLEAKDGKLKLSATDLEIGIETSLSATIEEAGSITLPAKLFLELVNSLPADNVTLETKGTTVEVTCRRVKSNLAGLSAEEFPTLFEDKGEPVVTLSQEYIKTYFSRVCFAASSDTTRPALSGILLQKQEDGFLIVATDGYRLSLQKNIPVEEAADIDDKPILIPARVIREVLSEKGSEPISIFISRQNNQVLFQQEDSMIIGRLIEANYPPYKKIIPADFSTKVTFDREEMQKAIKTCAIFARETANIIKLSIKKDAVIVSANTPSVGDNVVEVEAQLDGEENEIAFNSRYLLDAFANIDAEQMSFEMTGPLNSGVFKIANDESFLHLIMPIRTQG